MAPSANPPTRSVPDIAMGDPIPARVVEEVGTEQMKTMAALLHDPNPIHFDVDAVKSLGMGDRPVNQGPTNLAYVINALVDWSGDVRTIRNVACRFNGNVFAGDHLEAAGVVTDVGDDDGVTTVECDVWLVRGEDRVVTGTARLVWDDLSR